MRGRLERVDEKVIRTVVANGWGLRISGLRYCPVGGGAYHWVADAHDGRRWFVTCDDLDTKPWLGSDRDSVFNGLLGAYGVAMDLRTAGLSFVAAPIATVSGAAAERVDERHSVSVSEYVDGDPGEWGQPVAHHERGELVTMLGVLHRATTARRRLIRRGLEVPGRQGLEEALNDLEQPWRGGPLAELARRELDRHVDTVARWLTDLDRFDVRLADGDSNAVVTHGEPHPGNLIRTGAGVMLVDWDTVALARPERDLWMIVDTDRTLATVYRDLTNITLERDALVAYRLLWAVTDIAAFTVQLRSQHRPDADAEKALDALRSILNGREPSPYGASTRQGAPRPLGQPAAATKGPR